MPTFTDSAVRQLSDGNANGTVLGKSTTDLISFYNVTPVVQPSGSQQAAINNSGTTAFGQAGGSLTQYATSQSPSSVTAGTTSEQSITVTGVQATDLVIINKPTSQAGLGLLSGRVSSANTVKLTFANVSTASISPSGSETYLVTTVPANFQLSASLSPASVPAGTVSEQSFTVTGAQPGMVLQANKPSTQTGLGVLTARVTASNTVAVTFLNDTSAAITPTASETYTFAALNGLVAASSVLEMGVNVGTLSSVTAFTSAESSVTAAGINASDAFVGISKPTTQAGLVVGGGRVSAANTVAINLGNCSSVSVTPTASEVYSLTLQRPNPSAVMQLITTGTLTPVTVAANTTAEQTFNVTGLTSGQPIVVSPNFNVSQVKGVGIAGARVSASNTLALTFINTTTASIVPPAGTYQIGYFPQTTPTAGNWVSQFVGPMSMVGANLLNGLRSALVSLGLIAGA